MPEESSKSKKVVISFDLNEHVGLDTSTFHMTLDGEAVGCLSSIELTAKINEKFGRLQYTQFRNVRDTDDINTTGIWELHSHGNEEIND